MAPLPKTQHAVLRCMLEHHKDRGEWSIRSAWTWGGAGNTDRALRALAGKGMVENLGKVGDFGHYRITQAGRDYLAPKDGEWLVKVS